ncbi:bactericidal permeability-increasing protein-like [Discoglossus pictus]
MIKLCCIVLCQLCLVLADDPGIKFRFTQKGLNTGLEFVMNYMTSEISSQALPDTKGSTTIESEPVDYEMTQIRIQNFKSSSNTAKFVPGTGIQVSIKDAHATVHNNWKLNSWLIKDSGTGIVNLDGINVALVIGVRRKEIGTPYIHLISCQSDIKEVKIQMLGGVSYFYDTFKDQMETLTKNTIKDQLCLTLRLKLQQLEESLSHKLSSLYLDYLVGLNFSLVSDPNFAEQYVEVGVKGMSYSPVNMTEFNLPPAPFPIFPQTKSMVCVGISEASMNSASQAYYAGGAFTTYLSKYIGFHTITTSHLASAFPELSKQFPKPAPVQVVISATKAPVILLKPSNLIIEFTGRVTAYASSQRSRRESLFSANMDTIISGNVLMSNGNDSSSLNLTGSITLQRIQLQIQETSLTAKPSQKDKAQKELQKLAKDTLIPLLSKRLKEGFQIPSFSLQNVTLNINQKFILMAADMQLQSETLLGSVKNLTAITSP